MLYGWEGNRRSGITLAMQYRLQWSNHLQAQGLSKRDECPAHASVQHGTLYLHVNVPMENIIQFNLHWLAAHTYS